MSNGDLILVGNRTGYGASEFEIIPAVLKVNAVFDVLFAKVIPLKPHDFLVSYGATTQTDDIVIFSHQINKPYIYLVKFEQSSFSYDFVKVFPVLNSSLHPYLTTTDEDGFAFVGRLIDTITFNNPYFFYKTNPEGEIDGLNSQDLCLEAMYDWSPIIVEHDFEVIDANSYESDDTFLTLDVPLPAPVVGIPSVFPTAEFSLPNEICADNCTAPTNLNNEYADTWDWWVEGADNEIFTIPNPGQICWEESGTYTVRQIISFQNCLDTFEQTIIIYPEIEPTLPDSIDICANENSGLNGVSQNANNYLWSTGELSAEINIEASGLYILNMDNFTPIHFL